LTLSKVFNKFAYFAFCKNTFLSLQIMGNNGQTNDHSNV